MSPFPSMSPSVAGPTEGRYLHDNPRDLRVRFESELAVPEDSRLRVGVVPERGVDLQGRGAVHGELVDVRRELVRAVQHVVEGDDLPGVRGHAAHRGDQARLGATPDLV